MFKYIGYAYAGSIYANRLGRGSQGCYYVELFSSAFGREPAEVFGPFDTIEAAESHCETIPAKWEPYSRRANPALEAWRAGFAA